MKFLSLKYGVLLNTRFIKRIQLSNLTGFFGAPLLDPKTNQQKMQATLILDKYKFDSVMTFDDDTEEFHNIKRFVEQYSNNSNTSNSSTNVTSGNISVTNKVLKEVSEPNQLVQQPVPTKGSYPVYTYNPTKK